MPLLSAYAQLLEEILLEKQAVLNDLLKKTKDFRYVVISLMICMNAYFTSNFRVALREEEESSSRLIAK